MTRKETIREMKKGMEETLGTYMEELDWWRSEMKKEEIRIRKEKMKERMEERKRDRKRDLVGKNSG